MSCASAPKWFQENIEAQCDSLFVEVDSGVKIHCLRWGKSSRKRGLVFVHGGGATCEWYRFIAPYFSQDFDVLALSNSGNGDSSSREEKYTMYNWSREIDKCCDAMGYYSSKRAGKPLIVAHSLGAFVTQNLLARMDATHKFDGAVLCDGAIRSKKMSAKVTEQVLKLRETDPAAQPRSSWKINPPHVRPLERFKLRPFQECENKYALQFIAESNSVKVDGQQGWQWKGDCNRESKVDWSTFPILSNEDVSLIVSRGVRVCWVYGENSTLCDAKVVKFVRQSLGKEIGIVGMPGAAHHLWLDQPLAFVSTLRGIFAGWQLPVDLLEEDEEDIVKRQAKLESKL